MNLAAVWAATNAELEAAVKALRIELEVRTSSPGFPSRPERWRVRGFSAAWDSGYESGWRGRTFSDPYTSWKHGQAYREGYLEGARQSQSEIDREIAVALAEKPKVAELKRRKA